MGGAGVATAGVGTHGVGALGGGVGECGMPRGHDPDVTGGDSGCGILQIFPKACGLGQAAGGGVRARFLVRITLTGLADFSKGGVSE